MAKSNASKTVVRSTDDLASQWTPADWAALEAAIPGLAQAIRAGGKFVIYPYCVSAAIVTFRRSSGVVYVAPGQKVRPWEWILISLVVGWWGIPWGPIWTIDSIRKCLGGGVNVTGAAIRSMTRAAQAGQASVWS